MQENVTLSTAHLVSIVPDGEFVLFDQLTTQALTVQGLFNELLCSLKLKMHSMFYVFARLMPSAGRLQAMWYM